MSASEIKSELGISDVEYRAKRDKLHKFLKDSGVAELLWVELEGRVQVHLWLYQESSSSNAVKWNLDRGGEKMYLDGVVDNYLSDLSGRSR